MAIKTTNTRRDEEDNSPFMADLVITVVERVHVLIRASKTGAATYGQLLDIALAEQIAKGKQVSAFTIELNEVAQHSLRQSVSDGQYPSAVAMAS